MVDKQSMPDNTQRDVENDFAELEAQLAECGPGVLDIMNLYGQAELTIKSAADYFSIINPSPIVSTSNTSG